MMYMFMHICRYTHTHTHTHTYIYIYIYICIHKHIYIYIYIYTYTYIYIYVYLYVRTHTYGYSKNVKSPLTCLDILGTHSLWCYRADPVPPSTQSRPDSTLHFASLAQTGNLALFFCFSFVISCRSLLTSAVK